MSPDAASATRRTSLSADYWRFWTGHAISSLGNAISAFALPLIIFHKTGSALELGLATAFYYVPYLLFGLPIGAWVDRVDRRRLMIGTDLVRATLIATVPLGAAVGAVPVWWIYAVIFTSSTLGIAFSAGSFAAVPFLVGGTGDLVLANARLQAGMSAAKLVGPIAGGAALIAISASQLLFVDAASFLASAAALLVVRRDFQSADVAEGDLQARKTAWRDMVDGVRYVLRNPLLRHLAAMAALVNLFLVNTIAQVVLLAKERLHANDAEVGWMYAAASAGVIAFSLAAPRLRRRVSLEQVVVGAILLNGGLTVVLSLTRSLWVGLLAYAGVMGSITLFSISTASLRQTITPSHMLGRVITVAMVIAWSVEPVGAVLGGLAIDRFGVAAGYAVVGGALILIAVLFTPALLRAPRPSRQGRETFGRSARETRVN
jgi:MFS family permease